ncbi:MULTISPECIES: DUF6362 family protein [Lysobacter]|uniref:DUF6362 family protein n=1 Tax=Lysobacter TaxID=68 RepID=UPI001F2EA512|nr:MULTISPECIES: DUF6362 family protein [Lysobacter]UJB19257.1 DUF6362 family protein [Lysobacter capsici]UJQ27018.1 DUF6362 family protein [Lysobacter gummosus]
MSDWTMEKVADRFHEAAVTARRLPAAKVQGYASYWPDIQRQSWEGYADERIVLRFAASPAAIDRFGETVGWLRWLDQDQRRLVWLRAQQVPWREVCARTGLIRKTAWRHWQHALVLVTVQLNGSLPRFAEVELEDRAMGDAVVDRQS